MNQKSESKVKGICGWFQIICRFLLQLVATEGLICDKLAILTVLLSYWHFED